MSALRVLCRQLSMGLFATDLHGLGIRLRYVDGLLGDRKSCARFLRRREHPGEPRRAPRSARKTRCRCHRMEMQQRLAEGRLDVFFSRRPSIGRDRRSRAPWLV